MKLNCSKMWIDHSLETSPKFCPCQLENDWPDFEGGEILPFAPAAPNFFSGNLRDPTVLLLLSNTVVLGLNSQRWAESRRRESLAKPKTSSPGLKRCENCKSASQIFENSAYGKGSILENHETRKKLPNLQRPPRRFITRKTSNISSTNHCCKNFESRKRLRKRSRKLWEEEMHTMRRDSSAMLQDQRRLERRNTHSTTLFENDILLLLMRLGISTIACPCSSSSQICPPHRQFQQK